MLRDATTDDTVTKTMDDRLQVTNSPAKRSIFVHATGQRIMIQSKEGQAVPEVRIYQHLREISAVAFASHLKKAKRNVVKVFAATHADINKALEPESKMNFRTKLHPQYQQHARTFDSDVSSQLSAVRGPKIDHNIEINRKDGKEIEPPRGPAS